jgi:hypothetical protein
MTRTTRWSWRDSAAIAKRLTEETASSERDSIEETTSDSFGSSATLAGAAEKVGGELDNDYAALEASLTNESVTFAVEANTLNNAATTLNNQAAALKRRAVALNVTVSVRAADDAALLDAALLYGGPAGA